MSSNFYTDYQPFNEEIRALDIETLDGAALMKWIESGTTQFGLGTAGIILQQSLSSLESRREMVIKYGPLIKGFPKEPVVTVSGVEYPHIDIIPDQLQARITPEIVQGLKNFVLPQTYPAALNKPSVPPNDSIQCAGPVSEAAMMYFNAIIPRYYATLIRTMLVALSDPLLGETYGRRICGDMIGIIDVCVIDGKDMAQAILSINDRIYQYALRNNYDMVKSNDAAAKLYVNGQHHLIIQSTEIIYDMLNDNKSQLYIIGVIDTLYRLVVNQVKVYKPEETAFELPAGSSGEICLVDVISLPSGIAKSPSIVPVNRLEIQREDPNVVNKDPRDPENRVSEKPGGPTYRLVMNKTSYTLSGVDRYTPQLFLKPSCRMNVDAEFVYCMAEGLISFYKVHSYNGIRCTDPFDQSIIQLVQNRFKFRVLSKLGAVRPHKSYWSGRNYSNHICPVICAAMEPTHEYGIKIMVPSLTFNMIHPSWVLPFPSRSKVKKKVETRLYTGIIGADIHPPHKNEWSMNFAKNWNVLTDNAMDYDFYSYAYTIAYDLQGAQQCNVETARNFSHADRIKPADRYDLFKQKRHY